MRFSGFLLALFFLSVPAAVLLGQDVEIDVEAPTLVPVGSTFRVEYVVKHKRPDRFIPPDMGELQVIAGPTGSVGRLDMNINGQASTVDLYIFTYVIHADKAGTFTLPPATAVVDGKNYTSRPVPFEVVEERGRGGAQRPQGGGQGGQQQQTTPEIAQDDIIIRAYADKTNVYKGEPVRVYFKLYTRVSIAGSEQQKLPSFNGFWTQQLSTDHYNWQKETYNGKVYNSRIVLDYLLYPQQSGTLTVEQFENTFIVQVLVEQQRGNSLFDDLFGGFPEVKQVSRKVSSATVPITVKEWPDGAPDSFNGAVGEFSMTAEFQNEVFSTNSAANYVVRITGSGNLPLVQAPRLDLPSSFEQYNVKTTESLNRTASGISGYRQFEYPVIPRAEGEYYIEPVKFTYFNPRTGQYTTLESKEIALSISPDSTGRATGYSGGGLVTGVSREELRLLDEDIRFIKLGSAALTLRSGSFMGSPAYFALLLLIFAAFAFALIYLQKRIKEMRNTEVVRGKRANKVALQRLKAAEAYLREGNPGSFYEEMLKALWGYMGDKLNIPTGILNKEIVREELLKRDVPQEYVSHYIGLISDCEYAQYSPAESGHMAETYADAVKAISKFESLIKKRK
ncbi:MAG: BatD family protein [Alistipes sp.]|nr:BatD family protein [Alistipes sp.]